MRLIDADAIKYTMLQKFVKGTLHEQQGIWKKDIDAQPTIDAVPVVRGEWIDMQPPDADGNVQCWCSVCGAGELHAENQVVPYCWKCGAKMNGGEDDG